MAITTLDGLIAGFQTTWPFMKVLPTGTSGRQYSTWPLAGVPGAGVQSASLNGAALVSNSGGSSLSNNIVGQLPWLDPASGNSYLARLLSFSGVGAMILLCDRLWHNGGITITSTSAQSITSPTWPARDVNGQTNGVGVLLGVEVSAAVSSGTPTLNASYTNSGGTSGRTATSAIYGGAASAVTGSFYPLSLQAGDVGVQSVQSFTLSATWTSGTINLVAYRIIAALDLSSNTAANDIDAITGGMPQMYNGSVPFLVAVSATNAGFINGTFAVAQG